jgi:hypothetical protein
MTITRGLVIREITVTQKRLKVLQSMLATFPTPPGPAPAAAKTKVTPAPATKKPQAAAAPQQSPAALQ